MDLVQRLRKLANPPSTFTLDACRRANRWSMATRSRRTGAAAHEDYAKRTMERALAATGRSDEAPLDLGSGPINRTKNSDDNFEPRTTSAGRRQIARTERTMSGPPDRVMIDSTHLETHRTAASLLKGDSPRLIGPHKRRAELQAASVLCLRTRHNGTCGLPVRRQNVTAKQKRLPPCSGRHLSSTSGLASGREVPRRFWGL